MLNLKQYVSLPALALAIFAANVDAGWWSDLKTGELLVVVNEHGDLLQVNRNAGELSALMHSEIDEAFEAQFNDAADDHLPQYSGYLVELADTAIRILDTLAAFQQLEFIEEDYYNNELSIDDAIWKMGLASVHLAITRAFEGVRKSKHHIFGHELSRALKIVIELGGPDMLEILFVKWEYNKSRADHKIENRRAEGGKVC